MKKIFLSLFLISALFFAFLNPVLALDEMSSQIAGQIDSYKSATTETTLSEKIGGVIKAVLSLVGVIFMILMVYAGFLWMTASGEEEKVTKATNIIKMATIGLIIIVASYSLTYFIMNAIYGGASEPAAGGAPPSGGCCAARNGPWGLFGTVYSQTANDAACQLRCDAWGSSCKWSSGESCPR